MSYFGPSLYFFPDEEDPSQDVCPSSPELTNDKLQIVIMRCSDTISSNSGGGSSGSSDCTRRNAVLRRREHYTLKELCDEILKEDNQSVVHTAQASSMANPVVESGQERNNSLQVNNDAKEEVSDSLDKRDCTSSEFFSTYSASKRKGFLTPHKGRRLRRKKPPESSSGAVDHNIVIASTRATIPRNNHKTSIDSLSNDSAANDHPGVVWDSKVGKWSASYVRTSAAPVHLGFFTYKHEAIDMCIEINGISTPNRSFVPHSK